MLESPAFRALSLSGHRVLARVEIELAHHAGRDNGRLPVTFEDFHKYGMNLHAIAPAIRECCALGFLQITEQGCAGNAEYRSPNKFRLTYRPIMEVRGNTYTNEWRWITTIEDAERIAREARQAQSPQRRVKRAPKNKFQCRKTPNFSVGNQHRKRKSPLSDSTTTLRTADSNSTIYISGVGLNSGRAKPQHVTATPTQHAKPSQAEPKQRRGPVAQPSRRRPRSRSGQRVQR
jgi:hypothetical protein